MIVDDAQWTPDGHFVLILLKGAQNSLHEDKEANFISTPGALCILPRLGVSFIRVLNPTRFNISRHLGSFQPGTHKVSRSVIGSSMAAKEDIMIRPQKFMQLIMSDIVNSKLKSIQNFLEFNKKWQI